MVEEKEVKECHGKEKEDEQENVEDDPDELIVNAEEVILGVF